MIQNSDGVSVTYNTCGTQEQRRCPFLSCGQRRELRVQRCVSVELVVAAAVAATARRLRVRVICTDGLCGSGSLSRECTGARRREREEARPDAERERPPEEPLLVRHESVHRRSARPRRRQVIGDRTGAFAVAGVGFRSTFTFSPSRVLLCSSRSCARSHFHQLLFHAIRSKHAIYHIIYFMCM